MERSSWKLVKARVSSNKGMVSQNDQYDWLMKRFENSLNFDKSDPVWLHVLEYYYKYGWETNYWSL